MSPILQNTRDKDKDAVKEMEKFADLDSGAHETAESSMIFHCLTC